VRTTAAQQDAQTSALYNAARGEQGRSLPLDGATFTRRANELLKQAISPKLGGEVDAVLNDIATGKTPLTVEYAEQIKTALGKKQRAAKVNNGDLAYAYGLVRQALEETPLLQQQTATGTLRPGQQALPGQLMIGNGSAPRVEPGQAAIDAFNAARKSAAAGFAWKDSAKFVQDALDDAAPDTFVRRHVINAPAGELAKLQAQIANNPDLLNATRRQIVDYVMERGSADPKLTVFSGAGLEKGLKQIGDRKLALFFTPAEIAEIKSAVNVARLSQSQPIGSAVNNSNSAAMMMGRLSDAMGRASGLPVLGPMVASPLQSLAVNAQTIPLRNLSSGLVSPRAATARPSVVPLAALLAAPSAQGSNEDRPN
jgi:hypothetical protein